MKKLILFAFIGVLFGAILVYRNQSRSKLEFPTGTAVVKPLSERTLADEMNPDLDVMGSVIQKSGDPVCIEAFRKVLDGRFFEWLETAEATFVPVPENCVPSAWEAFRRWTFKTEVSCKEKNIQCRGHLTIYRALLADGLTWDVKNYLDMTFSLLITKLYAEAVREVGPPPMPLPDLLAMCEALVQRRPNWFPAYKLAAVALYQRELIETDDELRAQVSARLDRELEKAQSLIKNDPILVEIERRREDSDEEPVDISQPLIYPSILNW